MHADDAATRTCEPAPLATALVILAAGASPAPALAAAATDAVQRIQRMLGPAEPLGRTRRRLLRTTAAALALAPVQTGRLAVVAEVADRFRQARRVLNHVADRYLTGQDNPWFPAPGR